MAAGESPAAAAPSHAPATTPEQKQREQALVLYAQRKVQQAAADAAEAEDRMAALNAFKGMAKEKIAASPKAAPAQSSSVAEAEARQQARASRLSTIGRPLPLVVSLDGVEMVAGTADGLADERVAVFKLRIECQGRRSHSFTESISQALHKHEQMITARQEPLCNAEFPAHLEHQLRKLASDLPGTQRRGKELAAYYAGVLDAATPEKYFAARDLLHDLYGVSWPTVTTFAGGFAWPVSTEKAVVEDDGAPTPRTAGKLAVCEPEELIDQFDEIDSNGNGELNWGEVELAVSLLFPGRHDAALKYAYTAADDDKDGVISRDEFVVLVRHMVYCNNIWHEFGVTDGDGSQEIGVTEFSEGCDMLGIMLTADEAAEAFEQIRFGKDDGCVTFDNFCIWCLKHDDSPEDEISATFTDPGPLGLEFREIEHLGIEVVAVTASTQAFDHRQLKVGMLLHSVNGDSVVGGGGGVIDLPKARPVTLGFRPGLTVSEKLEGEDAWRTKKARAAKQNGSAGGQRGQAIEPEPEPEPQPELQPAPQVPGTMRLHVSVPAAPTAKGNASAAVWREESPPNLRLHNRGDGMVVAADIPEAWCGSPKVRWYRWRPSKSTNERAERQVVQILGLDGYDGGDSGGPVLVQESGPVVGRKTVVFGQPRDLGLVLNSDDPLDQLWGKIDADGDGELGASELAQVLVAMGRVQSADAPETLAWVETTMKELDEDGSGDVDIAELQDWYNKQPERSVAASAAPSPVRIASTGGYAYQRKLRKGMCVLSVQGKDTRSLSLREVDLLIRTAGRPLTMEFDTRDIRVQDAEIDLKRKEYAASKIQAMHRGKMARRQLAAMKQGGDAAAAAASLSLGSPGRLVKYTDDDDDESEGEAGCGSGHEVGLGREYRLTNRDLGFILGCTVVCTCAGGKCHPDVHLNGTRQARAGWLGVGVYTDDGTPALRP